MLVALSISLAALLVVPRVLANWRSGVVCAFALMYLEDSVRKLIFGQPFWVLLARDALLATIYLAIFFGDFIRYPERRRPVPLASMLTLWVSWTALHLLVSWPDSILVGGAVVRTNLFFLPLLYIGYRFFHSERHVAEFMGTLAVVAVPLAIIGMLQLLIGYHEIETQFPVVVARFLLAVEGGHTWHSHGHHPVSIAVSAFSSSGRYAKHGLVLFLVALGWLCFREERSKRGLVLVMAAALGLILAGRRLEILLAFVFLLCFLGLAIFGKRQVARQGGLMRLHRSLPLLALLAALLSLYWIVTPSSVKVRADFVLYAFHELATRSVWLSAELLKSLEVLQAVAFNAGRLGQESQLLNADARLDGAVTSDSGVVKILLEGGLVGLTLFALVWGSVAHRGYRCARQLRGERLYPIALSFCFIQISVFAWIVKGHTAMSDAAVLMIFWFFSGALFRLPELTSTSDRERPCRS